MADAFNLNIYRYILMLFTVIGIVLAVLIVVFLQSAEDQAIRNVSFLMGGFVGMTSFAFWIGAETLRKLTAINNTQPTHNNAIDLFDDEITEEVKVTTTSPLDAARAADQIFRKGFEAFRRRDYQTAIRLLTEAIHMNPDHAQAYHYRGLTYRKIGDEILANRDQQKANRLKRERQY